MRYCFTKVVAVLFCLYAIDLPAPGQKQFAERDPAYRLQPGDTVEVQYRYTPEYNGIVMIQPDGVINLQIVGSTKVGGTLREAESLIVHEASTRLNRPEVTVLLRDFVKPYFVVTGEVNHPGRFDIHGTVTALEAIAISGGFKESSKHSQVILVRKYNSEFAQVSVLNMKAMMTADRVSENPELRPGDLLVVPQNTVSKLERYIRWASLGMYGAAVMVP